MAPVMFYISETWKLYKRPEDEVSVALPLADGEQWFSVRDTPEAHYLPLYALPDPEETAKAFDVVESALKEGTLVEIINLAGNFAADKGQPLCNRKRATLILSVMAYISDQSCQDE